MDWIDSTMEKLQAENKRLRTALRPFAVMADQVDLWQKGDPKVNFSFDANDLRRARAALDK